MKQKGFIRLSRGYFEDFLWNEARVYSRAEAWLDLIQMARFEASTEIINGKVIELQRGEIPVSRRFLELRWNWGSTKVSNFLNTLTKSGRINQQQPKGQTVIKLVKYDVYNNTQTTDEPQNKPPTNHRQTTNKPPTNHRQTTNKPPTNQNKEYKELKESKKDVLLEKEPKGGFVSETEDLKSDKSLELQKRKKVAAKKEKFDFRQAMLNEGFDEELTDEWLRIRKKKKAVDSEIAFKLITSQIEKAKLEKNEILKIIVRKQWKGFEAKWLDENKNENERNYNSISNSNTAGGYKKSKKVSAHALLAERLSKSTSRDDHSGTIDAEFEVV
ncbi:hypothetical protein V2H21_01060 [Riemerella anatipestifer]|uniref:hypothetical protein n=1 Tax=Riemerella anatipestifer TaxID=34085 RepID=UPI002E9B8EE7|nr:hypothetical protein [Riemerella anatipestifer]